MASTLRRAAVAALAIGWLAGCGASDEEKAFGVYLASRDAIRKGDAATLRTLVAAEHASDFDGPNVAMLLEMAGSALPQDIRLKQTSFADGVGTLTLTATSVVDGGPHKLAIPAEGSVRMVRESGQWKIDSESWNIQMERAVPIFDVKPFLREGQRPVALKRLAGHTSGATQIAYTPNWQFVITASYGDYSLRAWDVSTGALVSTRTLESRPTSLVMSPDGRYVITGDVEENVLKWPLDSSGALGEPGRILRNAGQHVALSPDAAWLAVTSYGAPVVIYDHAALKPLQTLAGSETLRTTVFSPDGSWLAGSEGNELWIWETRGWASTRYRLGQVSPDSSNGPIAVSRDGRYLGIPCGDSSIIVFDVDRRRVLHDFFVSGAAALVLRFSPDGSQFATAQNNQQINLWSMQDHERVGYVLSKKSNATALEFSPDGRFLIAGHDDRDVIFWGVAAAGEKPVAPSLPLEGAVAKAQPPVSQVPHRVSLLSKINYLDNPNADQHQQFWKPSGDVSIEACEPDNPCFVTRYDGQFVGHAELPSDAAGKFILLIGTAAAERVHTPGSADQTGEAYIHGYGAALDPGLAVGKHYSARTLVTETRTPNAWSTLWGVFEVSEGIQRVDFEIRQADGRSAKDGSASRFDDLGVYLFDTAQEAQAFVARYEQAVGRVSATPIEGDVEASAPAAPAPAARADSGDGEPGITACNLRGRTVFMSKAQCLQQGGQR